MKKIVANRLKLARTHKGLTQAEIADLIGVERGSYTKYETGANLPTLSNLVRLSQVLGKSANYFLGMGTGNLSAEEVELLDLYRSIPPGDLKDNALVTLRATAQQARKLNREESSKITDEN